MMRHHQKKKKNLNQEDIFLRIHNIYINSIQQEHMLKEPWSRKSHEERLTSLMEHKLVDF